MKGFEPSASRATIWRANQLRHIHHIHLSTALYRMATAPHPELARQKGLEPLTYCLEGSCSILLSYWRILERVMGIEPTRPAWKAGVLPLNYTRVESAFVYYHSVSALSSKISAFPADFPFRVQTCAPAVTAGAHETV